MADIKIVDLNQGTALGADDAVVLVQGDTTLKVRGQDIAWGVKTLADLADKAYVDAIVANAPELLNTLKELADAIGDDPNFATSIRTLLDSKLPTANFGFEFWNALAGVTTYNITEDTNLYFTEQRVRDTVATELTTEYLTVKNISFSGTGAVNISSGNDLNLTAAGNILFNGSQLAGVAFSGNYDDLTGRPNLATVAISGSYSDLTNTPTAPIYNTVTILSAVTSPDHAATKSYVDSQLNSLPPPVWNSLTNVSNDLGPTRIALGRNAGGGTDADGYGGYGTYGGSGSPYAVAIGSNAGNTNQGGAAVGIGVAAGYTDQGGGAIAIGLTAGNLTQGLSAIAIGESSGNLEQGDNAIAIGNTAGYTSQGTNAIAIGKNAGKTNQPAGSIVINASGDELNGSVAGLYVDPIRSASATEYVAYYDPTTKEVTYGPAPSGGGSVGSDPTFNSVTTTDLNVQNVTFTGTGAVTITSGNDLNLVAAGNIRVNGTTLASVATSGNYNDLTNKPTVNYVQTIGNPVTVPSGSSLPYTIISGTITTTGNPVRIHISGDCYSNTGGNPRIQIYRGTTGLGRRMTITNNGSAIPYAIEVIDPVAAGTYTYSLKISSGSIGNGTVFGADDGNVLTITELK